MNICGSSGCTQPAQKKCGKCHFSYCSAKCQRNDWPRHKSICSNYAISTDPNYCPSSSQRDAASNKNYSGKLIFHEYDEQLAKSSVPAWKPIWDQATKAYVDGFYQDASKLFSECYRLATICNGEEHVLICQIHRNIGASLQRLGKYDAAEVEYLSGVRIADSLMWRGCASAYEVLVQALEGLASLYNIQDRMDEAEPVCLRSLQISEEKFGVSSPKIINSLRRLSALREKQGRSEEAIEHLVRAANVMQAAQGIANNQFVVINIDLVELYIRLDRLDEAEVQAQGFYAQLSEMSLKKSEEIHLADSAFTLGNVRRTKKQYAEGEPLFEQSLQLRLAHSGKDHITVAQALDGLAGCRQRRGLTCSKTEEMLLEVLRIYRIIDGPCGTNVAAALYYLSTLYSDRGELSKSESCQKRALQMKLQLCGLVHLDVAACYSNLAHTHRRQGRFLEAKEGFSKALEIIVAIHGPNNESAGKLRIDITVCAIAIGKQLDMTTAPPVEPPSSASIVGPTPGAHLNN